MRINNHKYSQNHTGETVAPPAYTGLTPAQFTTLLAALQTHLTWGKPRGRPPALALTQALKITLLYHRHNLTEHLLADFFSISQPTFSRTINLIEKPYSKSSSRWFNR